MSYLLLKNKLDFNATVIIAGVSDLNLNIKNRNDMEFGVFSQLIPNYQNQKITELSKRSAINWANELNSPVLLIHGSADWRVSVEHSRIMAKKLKKFNKPHKLVIYQDGEHELKKHRKALYEEVHKWLSVYSSSNTPK